LTSSWDTTRPSAAAWRLLAIFWRRYSWYWTSSSVQSSGRPSKTVWTVCLVLATGASERMITPRR
jgi:hypothetical protein